MDSYFVSAVDVLVIANVIPLQLESGNNGGENAGPAMYWDVNGDYFVENDDAALVTDFLNEISVNEPPFANAGGPYLLQAGDNLNLLGSMSSDPDDGPGPLSYEWDLDGNGAADYTNADPSIDWPTLETGFGYSLGNAYSITLTVRDGIGSASAGAEVIVAANQPPFAFADVPSSIIVGDSLWLMGSASYDSDNAPSLLTYAWDINNDGTVDFTDADATIDWHTLETIYGFSAGNTFPLKLTVSDGMDQGEVFTAVAVIAANQPPTISAIADRVVDEDTSTGNIGFSVGDAETPSAGLIVSASSSDATLVPNVNILLGGIGAGRTVNVTPAAHRFGSAVISITVTDGDGASMIRTFAVRVNSVNDVPTISAIGDQIIEEDTSAVNIAFMPADVETAPDALVVSAISSNTALVPNGCNRRSGVFLAGE